jgi:hypothetical protein
MSNRFEIGDIVSVNNDNEVIPSRSRVTYLLITDIDFTLQKYMAMVIGSNETWTYTIRSMDLNFYKVA